MGQIGTCLSFDFVEVFETSSKEQANKYLSHGWKLIDTFIICEIRIREFQTLFYVLGRPSNVEPFEKQSFFA